MPETSGSSNLGDIGTDQFYSKHSPISPTTHAALLAEHMRLTRAAAETAVGPLEIRHRARIQDEEVTTTTPTVAPRLYPTEHPQSLITSGKCSANKDRAQNVILINDLIIHLAGTTLMITIPDCIMAPKHPRRKRQRATTPEAAQILAHNIVTPDSQVETSNKYQERGKAYINQCRHTHRID
jgi:hypothetical protein